MFNIIKIDARETIYITICVAINTTHTLWYIFLPCPFIQYLLISVEKAKLKMNKFNIKKIKQVKSEVKGNHFHISQRLTYMGAIA